MRAVAITWLGLARRGRQRQQRERGEQKQVSYDSSHSADFLLGRRAAMGGWGRTGRGRRLPDRAAQASNHYGSLAALGVSALSFARVWGIAKRLRPVRSCKVAVCRSRCAILPPVPVPYREPLFARLAERGRIEPRVIYLAGQPAGLGPARRTGSRARGGYDSEVLHAWQRARAGRTPVMLRARPRARRSARRPGLRGELGVRPRHLARARLVRGGAAGRWSCSAS